MRSYKARGIVLGTVKYGDKAVIVNMFTDTFGRQSYIVQGLGSGKGRGSKYISPSTFGKHSRYAYAHALLI